MKKLLLTAAILGCVTTVAASTALGRPQVSTPAIGWLDPSDIRCFHTSDHTCSVTEGCDDCSVFAFVWADRHGMRQKYRIAAKTPLVVISEGRDNTIEEKDDQSFTFTKRVKVAIVIDSDWDDNGRLVPTSPSCHLATEGKFPPIISVACKETRR